MTNLIDSSEAVYDACCWALLNFASMFYCERRSVCCALRSVLGKKLHLIWTFVEGETDVATSFHWI